MHGRPINHSNPLNRQSPLARGLASFWLPLRMGRLYVNDLTGRVVSTLTNGPTWVAGQNGFGAVNFDGTDDTLSIPLTSSFPRTAGTIHLSVKPSSSTGIRQTFMWRVDGSNEIGLVDFNGTFGLNLSCQYNAGGTNKSVNYATSLTTNQWANLTVTWDAGTASVLRLYMNGVEVGTAATSLGTMSASTPLFYHVGGANGSDYFQGACDAAILWERALSASEVMAAHLETKRGFPTLVNRLQRKVYADVPAVGGGGNRRRRLLCGVPA
jgi:hypothetical protein